jgi:hypothetical protein
MIIKVHYHIYNEKFKIATTDNLIVGHHITRNTKQLKL